MNVEVNIARDFSEFPFGRYDAHGPFNGSKFRQERLIGPLKAGEVVRVELAGARGLAASFLEEAFGGLVREGFSVPALERQLIIQSSVDPSLKDEIWFYIRDAAKTAAH